ncbi:MAG: HDIG domain-containing protein [Bacteroides sp.]|nr:HDIG domain-containing protein [Bacteroides sp.]
MNPILLIEKYYPETEARELLIRHSRAVADKALHIAELHPELDLDKEFLFEASMLHDIGVFLTQAPDIHCHGERPYICHGYLGADLLRKEGLPRHALVCERHTGTGLSLEDILKQDLPLPHRNMLPVTPEEEVICFADKFFSKSSGDKEKRPEQIRKGIARYGEEGLLRFDNWYRRFLKK